MADDLRAGFSKSNTDAARQHPTGEAASPSYLDEALNLVLRRDCSTPAVASSGPTLEGYAKQFVKAVPLFLAGRTGIVGSALLYAADQMHSGASLSDNAMGGALGLAQGAALKWSFDKVGNTDWNPVVKGSLMGLSGRTVGTFFDYQNWKTADGSPSVGHALSSTWDAGSNMKSLAMDGVIFAGSFGVVRKLGGAGYESVVGSRLVGNAMAGTVFGASSGAYNEIERQQHSGQGFNPAAIAKESLISGAITGAAAIPGGLQASIKFHQSDFGPFTPAETKNNATLLTNVRDTTMPLSTVTNNLPVKNWTEFQNSNTKNIDTPVRLYNVAGTQTDIVVPKTYDDALVGLRNVRDVAAQPLKENLLSDPAQAVRIAIARMKLDLHPLAGHFLPEDLAPGVLGIPNSSMSPRLFALHEQAPYDVYRRQMRTYNGSPVIAERLLENSDLLFYKPTDASNPTDKVLHEWSHTQHAEQPAAFDAFKSAAELEQYGFYKSDYAKSKVEENWAEHSESLLGDNKEAFARFVKGAPIRAAVLGRALGETLANTPAEGRSPLFDQQMERVKWIAENVEPKARQELGRYAATDGNWSQHASQVLDYLNGKTGDFRK